jgi:putative DNA methylase
MTKGQVQEADATSSPMPAESAAVWFTDPPYYDAVPYADLSDFFFVWLKRALPDHPLLRDPFDPANPLTPKTRETVQNECSLSVDGKPKDRDFYETAMAKAFAEGRRVLREDGIGSVVFAHKTTEGWEALLSGLIKGSWTITASWPIVTERPVRLRARDSAALATSVHLICRPRPEEAPIGDWGDVLRELPRRVGEWMERLQTEGVRGADLVFACIGPALEIFSRYASVETADGCEVKLPEYLEKVWEVVGRAALEQVLGTTEAHARNGATGALEEDARLTALFLWTLQTTSSQTNDTGNEIKDQGDTGDEEEASSANKKKKGYTLIFDVVRRFAQPLGIELARWEDRIIDTEKGIVRLLPVAERARQLFGEEGVGMAARQLERDPEQPLQHLLFPEWREAAPRIRSRKPGRIAANSNALEFKQDRAATTLDRVHAAMLLQSGGQSHGLRALIQAELERGPDFLRLANALSALYPRDSEEKRLLDAMILAVPR